MVWRLLGRMTNLPEPRRWLEKIFQRSIRMLNPISSLREEMRFNILIDLWKIFSHHLRGSGRFIPVIQDDKDTNDRTKRDQGWTPQITSPPDIATWRVIYPIWRHFSSRPVKLDTVNIVNHIIIEYWEEMLLNNFFSNMTFFRFFFHYSV